ncbi:hypothetical protein [Paraglaciecola aestuariivivens]
MNRSLFNPFLLFLLIILVLIGLVLSSNQISPQQTNRQCTLISQQKCQLIVDEQKLSAQFLQPVALEEELNLKISLPTNTEIQAMWVQGINMYMGKHQLFTQSSYIENDQMVHLVQLFLGACSEPNMKWQLVIQTKQGTKPLESWFFNFETQAY